MADGLKVNAAQVESDAAGISTAAQYFTAVPLVPADSESTITANGKGQAAFNNAQSGIASYGSALDKDAANIRSLNVSFKEFDEMMGQLAISGYRTPIIKSAK